jgi:PAS domain S-box-containing protein
MERYKRQSKIMSNKYKILHIEDVATDAALAARELKKGNIDFEQYVVDTEKEYRKALDEYAPDIILCDHSLTTFNSSEALKIFKGKKIDIPFILITATLSDEFAISVLKEGADDYILKDRLKRLPSAVVNAIEKYQLNRERKQLVKKAKEKESLSQKRLKNLTNKLLLATSTTGIGIWEYLYNKKKLIADEVTLKQFGLECEDFKNCFSQLLQHVHPDDKIRVNREFQKSFLDYSNIDIEYKVVWKDASIHSVKAVAVVQQDSKGNPQRIIGTHQDITERKKTEEVIRKSEAFNKGVLDSLSSHIAVINSLGTIIKVNKLWKIFGNDNSSPTAKQWGVGSNYFDACIAEGDNDTSSMAVAGIKKVLEGTLENFYLEYPCHSPTEQRWFYMRVKKFDSDDASALIEHQDITERKIAEEKVLRTSGELQQISNDLTNILDSSLDIICTIDGQGKFVKVSAAAEKIWGYTSWELLGTSAMDIVFEDDVENTRKVASGIMDGTPVTMFENRYKRKNGSIVPMLWSSRWDDKDKLSYCVAKDATEKKALEIEKERFQHLFFQAPSCMGILKGPNHIYESANPLLLQLLGRNADIIGKTVEEAVPEMVEQGFLDNLNVVYKTGVAFAANERLVKIDRHQTGNLEDNYLNLILQAYKSNDGCVAGIFIFAINVTEQVLSRKKVEESEKRYRQIVETAQEGIWMIDENNKTTFANEKMCEILECTQAEMVDTSNLSFRDEEEQKNAVEQIERRRKGIKETHEAKYRTKRGKQIWVNISTNPLFNAKGEYKGALGNVYRYNEPQNHRKAARPQRVELERSADPCVYWQLAGRPG